MNSSTARKFAPAFSDDQIVELAIDGDQTVVKLSKWVDGLGWCGQKTMAFDAVLLDELHGMIAAARVRIRHGKDAERLSPPTKILEFPKFS